MEVKKTVGSIRIAFLDTKVRMKRTAIQINEANYSTHQIDLESIGRVLHAIVLREVVALRTTDGSARLVVPSTAIIHTDRSTQVFCDFTDVAVANQLWLHVRLLRAIWAIGCGSLHRLHRCSPMGVSYQACGSI